MSRKEQFKKRVMLYRNDPVLFCSEVLNFIPDEWQADALKDLANWPKVSIRSGQGVGKTGIEAVAALWFLSCFPFARVVATAPTRQQLNDVLWSEVAKWLEKSSVLSHVLTWTKTYVYFKGQQKRWFATARTATKPENMQGFHEDNMLFIVDEASGVADPIMEAILGTLSGKNNKLLMCGNPTRTSGVFYDSHTADRALYKIHKVDSSKSQRTNKENIQSLIRKYGEDSNVVRVRVYGEFPLQEDDVFLPISIVEDAVSLEVFESDKEEKVFVPQRIDIGVDVARFGDDETVIAIKTDKVVHPLKVRHGQNLMATVGDVINTSKGLHKQYPDARIIVKVDDTGLGGGVTDRLREIIVQEKITWLVLVPVNFASSVPKSVKEHDYYDDIITYMWACLRDLLCNQQLKLPNDSDLVGQLTTRKYTMRSSGKVQLESKKAMKDRGLRSPDRADALVLATLPLIVREYEKKK